MVDKIKNPCPRCKKEMEVVRIDNKYVYLRCKGNHRGIGEVIHTVEIPKKKEGKV